MRRFLEPRLRVFRLGATLVELLVVLSVVGMLVSLLLPAVQAARETGRRRLCCERLRQMALASQSHVATHGNFPFTATTGYALVDGKQRLLSAESPHTALLAYLDPPVFDRIDRSEILFATPEQLPQCTSPINMELIHRPLPAFACPSDSGPDGRNNFRANLGPGPGIAFPGTPPGYRGTDPWNGTGAFSYGRAIPASEFLDGLSTTLLFSEKRLGDGNPYVYTPYRDRYDPRVDFRLHDEAIAVCRNHAVPNPAKTDSYSGFTWLMGGFNHTWYNHILTPNSPIPDCSLGYVTGGGPGVYTASSFHVGGVNAVFADGAAMFITDTVDLSVWRAMSTRAGVSFGSEAR